ncbi:hypothetical protein [Luteimicrobium sp. DT211]|uniref:hypothetical protein n=1 Tax=Luteimicrobium sp. DT211 TaxID=3393412 RepID=UPI003CE6DB8C
MLRARLDRRPLLALAALGTLLVLALGGLGAGAAQAATPSPGPTVTSTVQPGDRPDSGEGSGFPWVKVILGVAALGLVSVAIVGARTRRSLDRGSDDPHSSTGR